MHIIPCIQKSTRQSSPYIEPTRFAGGSPLTRNTLRAGTFLRYALGARPFSANGSLAHFSVTQRTYKTLHRIKQRSANSIYTNHTRLICIPTHTSNLITRSQDLTTPQFCSNLRIERLDIQNPLGRLHKHLLITGILVNPRGRSIRHVH